MQKNFINNGYQESMSNNYLNVINPANEEIIDTIPLSNMQDVEVAVEGAFNSQKAWAKETPATRANIIKKLIPYIEQEKEKYAKLYVQEQGKTYKEALGEIEGGIKYINFMVDFAMKSEGSVLPSENVNETIMLVKKPIGVVAGIIPWNAPFYILMRKAIPALVAGCSIVIKPSEETPLLTLKFAELMQRINLPSGLFQVIAGTGKEVGRALAEHPKIAMVSLTGGVPAGKDVMKASSNSIKRINLELGGKAPAIVSRYANVELAAKYIVEARINNSGQVCTCPERLYVHEDVYEKFLHVLEEKMKQIVVGDPLDEKSDMGTLINKNQLEHVEELVESAIREGAEVLCGGKRINNNGGFFYEPTIITNVEQHMKIIRKEIFGPVLPIIRFNSFDQVLEMANDSDYGLSSYIFTDNYTEAFRAMNEMNFGEVYVNCEAEESMNGYHSGWRQSGDGGTDGIHGYEEFLKTTVGYFRYGEE